MTFSLHQLPFSSGERILFQGDSITAADRNRDDPLDLGKGYVAIICGLLVSSRPDLKVTIWNRGEGGNRTSELLMRWDADCLQLQPSWLSIMIGVNDVWRLALPPREGKAHIPLRDFVANYRQLLDRARTSGITNLILMSPTFIERDMDGYLNSMIAHYDQAVALLAEEYGGIYVPVRQRLRRTMVAMPDFNWLRDPNQDGCHPNIAGHALIADTWLETLAEFGQRG